MVAGHSTCMRRSDITSAFVSILRSHHSAATGAASFLRAAPKPRQRKTTAKRKPHGDWIFHDAVASAGVRIEGGPRLGPAGLRWLDELGYRRPGSASTTPRHGSRIRRPICWWRRLSADQEHPLGPGGFLLPYHHPAELANRVAMLDHLSDGRLNFGVAASGLPSDWAMFNVDGMPAKTAT